MGTEAKIQHVLVTGATGFVGRSVVRELLRRGLTPVCLVRDPYKLIRQHVGVDSDRFVSVVGDLADVDALAEAAGQSQAAVHLVGIIIERRLKGQTFRRVHVRGTANVVEACRQAGVKRFLHMSALGARPDAATAYHQTKWAGEQLVRDSGLDWTMFRPSLIHGPDGEFMRLMKRFCCGLIPPMMPYFGTGQAKIQPVSVKDVACCFAEALARPETIGRVYELGGPRAYTWIELYNACRALMPKTRHWKPMVSQPVPVARLMALLSAPVMAVGELIAPSIGLFRFDGGQVTMAQEDNCCDRTEAEEAFDLRFRSFEDELSVYADQIR